MFQYKRNKTLVGGAFTTAELVFHAVVRNIRSQHANAVVAIFMNVLQMVLMTLAFYLILTLMGGGIAKIRGEFILYLLTGVFLYMTNIKSVSAIARIGSGNNPMMLHSPMNRTIILLATALGTLYTQILSILVILFGYSVIVAPLEIQEPGGAFGMLILAWFTGCSVGLVLLALTPWFPKLAEIVSSIYTRLNMFFSGKMFVANALGGFMLTLFIWNPLFHIIDQCRGFVFKNYFPRNTSWEYALWVGLALVTIGFLAEFYTRKHVSQSWEARR